MFFNIYLLIILTLFFFHACEFHVFLIDLLTKPNEIKKWKFIRTIYSFTIEI
jgi:hypothetical protein